MINILLIHAYPKTKKMKNVINEINFSNEDVILILRIFLSKTKRLLKIKNETKLNSNLEVIIKNFKPPIFWKDQEIIKQQISFYSKNDLEILLQNINELEIQTKKNYNNSINILLNFIVNHVKRTSN